LIEVKTSYLIAALLSAMLIGGVIGWYLKPCEHGVAGINASAVELKIDTVFKEVQQPPIKIAGKARIIKDTTWLHDTVLTTAPFIAVLDTVIQKDTLNLAFRYPSAVFEVELKQAPDLIPFETRTVTLTNTIYEQRAWWLDALTHIGAVAVGYVAGTITN